MEEKVNNAEEKWYAIYTRPRAEKQVYQRLTESGIETYLPMQKTIRQWSDRKKIVEKQEKFGWGKSIVENLVKDLQKEYPGIKGFSSQNLWYMRQFYTSYCSNLKLQPMVGEISWVKNVLIFVKYAK